MNKNAIKKFAIEARKKLIASVSDRAGMLGITPFLRGQILKYIKRLREQKSH